MAKEHDVVIVDIWDDQPVALEAPKHGGITKLSCTAKVLTNNSREAEIAYGVEERRGQPFFYVHPRRPGS
jgi:hypothetical protein